jgi:hypothetical protein
VSPLRLLVGLKGHDPPSGQRAIDEETLADPSPTPQHHQLRRIARGIYQPTPFVIAIYHVPHGLNLAR